MVMMYTLRNIILMAKNIGIPTDLLRYVIVNSTLTTEEKRSIGFDRPDFTEYKF